MSAAEIIEALPQLTKSELLEVQDHLLKLLDRITRETGEGPLVCLEWKDDRLLMHGNRTITQAEIEDILADFP